MLAPYVVDKWNDLTYITFCYIYALGYNFTEPAHPLKFFKTYNLHFMCLDTLR